MLKRGYWFWFINILFCLFLILRGFFDYQNLKEKLVVLADDNEVRRGSYWGYICSQVDRGEKWQRFTFCSPTPILVYTKLYPEYSYGDFLSFKGEIKLPTSFSDFNYPLYLAAKNIYFISYYPQLEIASGRLKEKEQVLVFLNKVKERARQLFNKNLPEPEASLANALIWGFKKDLFAEDIALFRDLGISHLVVISGLHVSILGGIILLFFYLIALKRRFSLILAGIFLFVYLIFVGLSSALLRATITFFLILIARYYKRLTISRRMLMLTFNLVLTYRPVALYLDIGFQLSFLAVFGIYYIYPLHLLFFKKIRKSSLLCARLFSYFFSTFFLTLACQLASWPILINNFQGFSALAFLVNPSVAWLMPLILAPLLLAFLFSIFLPSFSFFFFLPAYFFLSLFFKIINLFDIGNSKLIAISPLSSFGVIIYYLILFISVFILRRKYLKGQTKTRLL